MLDHDRPLSAGERAGFRESCQRLLAGEPLAYVLGYREFFGRRFAVGPSVLIPRPETELLVERARAALPAGARVFEPGTGSGCVGISLALEREDLSVTATDVSQPAVALARENAAALGAELELLTGCWWEPVAGRRFDALIANPPYVDRRRPELLGPGVADSEPHIALFAPDDEPTQAYRDLLGGGVDGLEAGALVLLEVGVDTAASVLDLVTRSRSYVDAELVQDLEGRDRVLSCRRRAGG